MTNSPITDHDNQDLLDHKSDVSGKSMHSKSKTPSIYKTHHKNNGNNNDLEAKSKHFTRQKWWVCIHGIFLLSVSFISVPLLMGKAKILNEYYDPAQCCYCLWVGHNTNLTHDHKIEWFPCVDHNDLHQYKQTTAVCNLNSTINITHCAPFPKSPKYTWKDLEKWKMTIFQPDQFSTSSSIAGLYKFHKYYPYYGIISVVITSLYFAFLVFRTFIFNYKKQLDVVLFVGNVVLTINCYYSYIKCYQYSRVYYNKTCNNPPPVLHNGQHCYQSAITPFLEFNLHLLVFFVSIYVVYPILVVIMFWKCKNSDKCRHIQHNIEAFFRYFGIFVGIYFVIICFGILLYIIVHRDAEYNLMDISPEFEKAYIIFVCIGLFILTFDVLILFDRCKQETKNILSGCCCCCNVSQFKSVKVTFLVDENDD